MKKTKFRNIMRKNTQRKAVGSKILQPLISYLLLASIVFLGLPLNLQAQMPGDQETLRIAGNKVSLRKMSNAKTSKMSAQSYSEMKIQAAQNNSGAAVKTAQSGEVEYAVLNVEFKTPVARQAVFTDLKQSNSSMQRF